MIRSIIKSLGELRISGRSPDDRIYGVLVRSDNVEISFKPNSYYDYEAPELEYQLSRMLDLLQINQIRQRRELLTEGGLSVRDLQTPHWNAKMRRLAEYRQSIAAIGLSKEDGLSIGTVGGVGFDVKVTPECLRDLDELEFQVAFSEAVQDMYSDFMSQFKDYKRDIYGLSKYEPKK